MSALPLRNSFVERSAHIVLRLARHVVVRESSAPRCAAYVSPRATCSGEIERRQLAQRLQFQHVAAPAEAQTLQSIDGCDVAHRAGLQRRVDAIVDRFGGDALIAAILYGVEQRAGVVVAAFAQPAVWRARVRPRAAPSAADAVRQPRHGSIGDFQVTKSKRGLRLRDALARLPFGGILLERRLGRLELERRVVPIFQRRLRSARARTRRDDRRRTRLPQCRYAHRENGPSCSRRRRAWSVAAGRFAAPDRATASDR